MKGKEEEGSDNESTNSDAEEQMGETEEGADRLDKQIWDAEEDNDAEEEEKEGT